MNILGTWTLDRLCLFDKAGKKDEGRQRHREMTLYAGGTTQTDMTGRSGDQRGPGETQTENTIRAKPN